jgi:hypothetical protein
MSSIYVSDALKAKLIGAARKRGYIVTRGRQSQLAEFLDYLIQVDSREDVVAPPRRTLEQAMGLASVAGKATPTDAEVESMLEQRRLQK